MATEREHEVRRIVEGRRIENGLDAFWQVARHVGRPRNFLDRLCGLRRALHDELPVRELEIFLSGFEEMRRNLSRLVPHFAGGQRDRPALHGSRSTAIRALAVGRQFRVAMHNLDIGHRDPELVRDDLGERRLFALTVRVAPRIAGSLSGGMEPAAGGTPKAPPEPRCRDDLPRAGPAEYSL